MRSDQDLGLDRPITRRQFCQGTAVALGASLAPWAQAAPGSLSPEITTGYYPPAAQGMRGAHVGAFETAHGVVREGRRWTSGTDTGEGLYDLVVVGAGLSGLSAAWFYRQQKPGARILVLDNHDDFGGHAKRNEFTHEGRTFIGYGGSQSIDTPSSYSPEAIGLLKAVGIDVQQFYPAFDRELYAGLGLQPGIWLDREHFGVDRLVRGNPFYSGGGHERTTELENYAGEITTNPADRDALLSLMTTREDYLAGRTRAEKIEFLRGISYDNYLRRHVGTPEYLIHILNPMPASYWGVGTDAISALEAMDLGMPGFSGLDIDPARDDPYRQPEKGEPYIFHFPDGNAGIARCLVRQLVPGVAPGDDMMDVVQARFDYSRLDQPGNEVNVRLNATAVQITHHGDVATGLSSADRVNVRYVKDGRAHDLQTRQLIYAGYSAMLPHICPEFPADQATAFATQVKVPLLYASMLVRNWEPFVKLGVNSVRFPGGLVERMELDYPVSMGGYQFSSSPADPTVVHWVYIPTRPHEGLDAKTQNRLGRHTMLDLSFEDYERAMRQQSGDALSAGGFDPAGDILGLTVNRWPHGYAYEYNELYDPPEYDRYTGPHVAARQPFGRISIAGSDAEAYAYVNGAIDAAWRAVSERLA